MLSESARETSIAAAYLPVSDDGFEGEAGFKDVGTEPPGRAASMNFRKKRVPISVKIATPYRTFLIRSKGIFALAFCGITAPN
jgi:hypothetical protein